MQIAFMTMGMSIVLVAVIVPQAVKRTTTFQHKGRQ
jgi:hypothetical protein